MKKVLVVDDNENILQVLKELLEVKGFKVSTMEGNKAVLERVQSSKPDFVLLDISMGNANGYEIYKVIKANILTSTTPVLLMSSSDLEESMFEMKLKSEDIILKPFDLKHLMVKLNSLQLN